MLESLKILLLQSAAVEILPTDQSLIEIFLTAVAALAAAIVFLFFRMEGLHKKIASMSQDIGRFKGYQEGVDDLAKDIIKELRRSDK